LLCLHLQTLLDQWTKLQIYCLHLGKLRVIKGKCTSQMAGAGHCYFWFCFASHTLASTNCSLIHACSVPWSEHAIVTLWGEQADLFDADGFLEASSEEPVIVLFVGMTVSQYSGDTQWTLFSLLLEYPFFPFLLLVSSGNSNNWCSLGAFKSTSFTRWHVNVPIPEIAAARERFVFRLVSARKRSIAICCLFSNVRAVHMLPVKTFTMAYRATKRKPESRWANCISNHRNINIQTKWYMLCSVFIRGQ
jgi:hypothetical protein